MASALVVSEAAAEAVADEWCTLLAECVHPKPFQYHSWQRVWWQHFGGNRQPLLLTVRDGGRLVGLASLMRENDRLLLAGDPNIQDYMDVVVAADAGDAVYAALFERIAAEPWQELVLWGVPDFSRTLTVFPELARASGMSVEDEYEATCPRITPLPDSWDRYLESLSKKDRHELRRKIRRFQEAGADMTLYAVTEPEGIAAGLDDFIRLHTSSRRDKAEFMTPEMEAFFRDMAPTLAMDGIVRLFFIELNHQRVAALLAFDVGGELMLYNSGYDPAYSGASVGLVSKALTLKAAIEDGKTCYDFLRGVEPYKYDLGATSLDVRTLTVRRS